MMKSDIVFVELHIEGSTSLDQRGGGIIIESESQLPKALHNF